MNESKYPKSLFILLALNLCLLLTMLILSIDEIGDGARFVSGMTGMQSIVMALGLGLIAFTRPLYLRALGGVALIIPHLIGAPAPDHHGSLAPEEIAERFVYASLATSAAFWLALGPLTAFLHRRIGGGDHSRFLVA